MGFKAIDHIVVRVRDLTAGIKSYEALGLTLERTGENRDLGIKQAFFPLPDGSFIEVVAPLDPTSPVGKALESRGEGIHSIVFAVEDLTQASSQIKSNGAQLIGEGGRQVFVHPKSTHGVLVQMTERK